jgi:hypothetical protein
MFIKKVLLSALIAVGTVGAVAIPLTSYADISINIGPPEPRYEAVPVQAPGYTWSPGYWDYRNNSHVWVAGSSVQVREGYNYTPHRWVKHDGNWSLEQGHYDRR